MALCKSFRANMRDLVSSAALRSPTKDRNAERLCTVGDAIGGVGVGLMDDVVGGRY